MGIQKETNEIKMGKNKRYHVKYIFLLLIILFSAYLRFYKLNEIPPGFHTDEAAFGYIAYSISETGRELNNNPLPILIWANKVFFSPVFTYSLIPFIKFFGLNEFSVRAASASWGVLTILATFFLCEALFSDSRISLLASFFLSISPFHIIYSRLGFELTSMPFFLVMGFLFLLKARNNTSNYVPAAILFGVGIYTYNPAWLFFPLFISCFFMVFRSRKKLDLYSIISIFLFLFISSQVFFVMFLTTASWFNTDNNGEYVDNHPYLISGEKSVANMVSGFLKNYLKFFGFNILFRRGDWSYTEVKHTFGVFYDFQAILIPLGLLYLFQKKPEGWFFLVLWLFIAPIPSSLVDFSKLGNYILIKLTMSCLIPLPDIISATGLIFLIDCLLSFFKKSNSGFFSNMLIFSLLITFVLLSGWEVVRFLRHVFHDDSYILFNQCSQMASAMKPLIQYGESVKEEYTSICISPNLVDIMTGPLHHLLFYTKYNPKEFQDYGLTKTKYKIARVGECFNESESSLYIIKEGDMKYSTFRKKFFCGYNETRYVALTAKDFVFT